MKHYLFAIAELLMIFASEHISNFDERIGSISVLVGTVLALVTIFKIVSEIWFKFKDRKRERQQRDIDSIKKNGTP